jgi:aspartate-semialdehyde dehydrogenase (peptidoglycan organisms)
MKKYNFAVVGATGLVGRTFLKVLEEYNLPINELRLFASEKSEGKTLTFKGKDYVVHALKEGCFVGIDFALFSAGAGVSKVWSPIAAKEGALVVDNSSCWRMDDNCALIVPEINLDDYKNHSRIIANPNCSTIQSVLPLKAIDEAFNLKRIVFTTYQACSGSGKKGLDDLERCEKGEDNQYYPYNIAKTCIPEIDEFLDNGYTKEEMKMVNETHKILHHPEIKISATCVRVPVAKSHAVSIMCECEKDCSDLNKVREIIRNYPGIKLVDDPKNHQYPVSTMANDNDFVYVGRIRKDLSCDNGLLLYCVGDNVRKGAASNAVQIVREIIKEKDHE